MLLCMASAFQQENATAMSSKHKTRPERRHNLDKRAAAHLRANPFLKDVLEPALDRDPTLEQRLFEGLWLFARQPGLRRYH